MKLITGCLEMSQKPVCPFESRSEILKSCHPEEQIANSSEGAEVIKRRSF